MINLFYLFLKLLQKKTICGLRLIVKEMAMLAQAIILAIFQLSKSSEVLACRACPRTNHNVGRALIIIITLLFPATNYPKIILCFLILLTPHCVAHLAAKGPVTVTPPTSEQGNSREMEV